jgi:hypothetical protein
MRRIVLVALAVASLAALGLVSVYAAPAETPAAKPAAPAAKAETPAPAGSGLKPDAEGWITLFDGKNLDAWQEPPAKKWKVVDGIMTWDKGCGDIWTKDKFGDFTIDLEFKCALEDKAAGIHSTNSGVFLRSPEGEKNWLQGSIEIQILAPPASGKADKHTTAAVYDCLAPSVFADKPAGEWNHMVLTAKGNSITIELNGKKVIETSLDHWTTAGENPDGTKNKFKTAYKDMAKVGYLGLQDHGAPVWYRNIKIKPLN